MSSTRNDLNLSGNLSLLDLDSHQSGPPSSLNLIEDTCELNFISPSGMIEKGESAADSTDRSKTLFPDQSIHSFDSDLSDHQSSDSDISSSELSSEDEVDLPRPKKTKVDRNLRPNMNDVSDPSLFNKTVVENIELIQFGKTQKGEILLFVKSFNSVKQLTVAAGGINKKSIKWRCSKRSCSGDLLTSVTDYGKFITKKESESGKRTRFELKAQQELTIGDLEPKSHKQHTCEMINDKVMITNKVLEAAKLIIDEKIKICKDAARSMLPGQIVREATSKVVATLDKSELERNRIQADTYKLPRRVYRILKMYKPTQIDFKYDNLSEFVIPPSFSASDYKIDTDLAQASNNSFLLFCSPEIKWLNDSETCLILDGTYPLKKKLKTFSQMWILYGIHPQASQMIGFCFMRNRKEESYRLVLRQLKDKLGSLQVKRIILDQEQGENNAAKDLIAHEDHQICYFHVLQWWHRCLKNKVGSYLPSARNKPTCENSKTISRIWAHCRLLPYFPLIVNASYVELLKEKTESISDLQAQSYMVEFLNKIRKDLSEKPALSWWSVLNVGDKPVWQDCTSNRLERFNLLIKQHISNFCVNKDKTVEVINTVIDFAQSHRDQSLIFDLNQVGRKPSITVRKRRESIEKLLSLLTLSDTSRQKLEQIFQLVEEISL